MKLSQKIPALVCALLFLLTLAGGIGGGISYRCFAQYHEQVELLEELDRQVVRIHIDLKEAIKAWKNLLIRGKDFKQFEQKLDDLNVHFDAANKDLRELQLKVPSEEMRAQVSQVLLMMAETRKGYEVALSAFEENGRDLAAADRVAHGVDLKTVAALKDLERSLVDYSAQVRDGAFRSGERAVISSILIMVFITVSGAIVSVKLSHSMTKPLVAAAGEAQRIARGDLTGYLRAENNDECGQLTQALNRMRGDLSLLVGQIREQASICSLASADIAKGNQELSDRTEVQSHALEKLVGAMNDFQNTVIENTDHASTVSVLASAANDAAGTGAKVIEDMRNTMHAISESSEKISEITSLIDAIAFQTNILALNAAVEAARAGEQGRGFAVVASEVRSLAARAREAAKQIKGLTEQSAQRVKQGVALTDRTTAVISSVKVSVDRVHQLTNLIHNASQQQADNVEMLRSTLQLIDAGTQQNTALVGEVAGSARELNQQSGQLSRVVTVFKLAR